MIANLVMAQEFSMVKIKNCVVIAMAKEWLIKIFQEFRINNFVKIVKEKDN